MLVQTARLQMALSIGSRGFCWQARLLNFTNSRKLSGSEPGPWSGTVYDFPG